MTTGVLQFCIFCWQDSQVSSKAAANNPSQTCQKAIFITPTCFTSAAMPRLQVSSKAAADFILGTCHKAKGCEEDYVQLADDFAPIRAGRQPGVEVGCLPSCGCCFACLLVFEHAPHLLIRRLQAHQATS
jgi:hypothetical protein